MLRLVLSYLTNYANYYKPSYPGVSKQTRNGNETASECEKQGEEQGEGMYAREEFLFYPATPSPFRLDRLLQTTSMVRLV